MAAKVGIPKDVAAVASPQVGGVRLFGKWDMEKTGRMENITIVQVCVPTYGIVTNHSLSVEGTGVLSPADAQEVEVKDISLTDYIALRNAVYTPHTAGRYQNKAFKKAQTPIVERLVNSLMMHGRNNGKKLMAVRIVAHAFEIINLLTDANPIQILVDAIINTGPREDSTRIGSAGTVRRQAVDVSPLRRVNTAITLLTTGTRESAFRNVKSIAECLADELINAAKGSSNSYAIKKRDEMERVARSNR
ncbi:hypothetical protein NDA17_002430 [Ustilago hordei]|nr:hypothetical protein NDA17_002430 [Ustilago hordei]